MWWFQALTGGTFGLIAGGLGIVLGGLALHRLRLAILAGSLDFSPSGEGDFSAARSDRVALPSVVVQVPIYNDAAVARRIIDAVCRLDYSGSRLEIQILDDSTDETVAIVDAAVYANRLRGVDVRVVRRRGRRGFKAGALANGLGHTAADLVAIFDADFLPSPDFLMVLVGEFEDADVGMVQARWGYLNVSDNALTAAQAVLLNGHFVNEHGGRYQSGACFNFNGTAGIWRRACIDGAGGWSGRTITEDLDLSYRAQLQGWRFVYRPDVVVPSELPNSVVAFKAQQHRWQKGAFETARYLLRPIWRSKVASTGIKLEASVHLLSGVAYWFALVLALLLVVGGPGGWFAQRQGENVAWCLAASAMVPLLCFYFLAERRLAGGRLSRRAWWGALLAVSVGLGLSITSIRAQVEVALGMRTGFVRTPKLGNLETGRYGTTGRRSPSFKRGLEGLADLCQALVELGLGLLFLWAAIKTAISGNLAGPLFLLLFALGLLPLSLGSLWRFGRSRAGELTLTMARQTITRI